MKKTFLTITMAVASYCSYAQYLPLTAGSSNPLTGDLYIDGTNGNRLIFSYGGTSNNKGLLGSTYSIFGGGSKDDLATYIRDNNPYSIWTNNVQRLIVDGSGNVGIGRTDPPTPLFVSNAFPKTNTNIRAIANFGSNEAITSNPFQLSVTIVGAASVANRSITLQTGDYGIVNAGNLALQAYGGNVGIGTTTPGTSLEIDADSAPTIRFNATNSSGGAGNVQFYNNAVQQWNLTALAGSNDFALYNNGGTNSYNLTVLHNNGYVGIGTTTPGYKLDVNGVVSSGVKDYSINSATYQLTNQSNVDGISGVSPTGAFRWYTNPNSNYRGGFLYQLRSFDAVNGESAGLLTIRGDGNVGVGMANPGYKLESVISDAGTNNITYPLSVDHLSSGAVTDGFGSGINFRSQNYTGTPIDAGSIRVYQNTTNTTKMTFSTIYGFNNFVDAMTLYNGNVGIGTINPAYSLHINKSTATLALDGINGGLGNSGAAVNLLGWATTNKNWQIGVADIGYDGLMFTPSTTDGGSTFTTPAMIINSNGNVVIGAIAAPACYKFAVAGDAVAQSMTVKLQVNWCDYVFKKDYALMPLSQVKTYIDENQHLPEIPSAAEVEKDGLNLGEMNRLLVKKVEELTLYLIELNKMVKDQQAEIEQLKKQKE